MIFLPIAEFLQHITENYLVQLKLHSFYHIFIYTLLFLVDLDVLQFYSSSSYEMSYNACQKVIVIPCWLVLQHSRFNTFLYQHQAFSYQIYVTGFSIFRKKIFKSKNCLSSVRKKPQFVVNIQFKSLPCTLLASCQLQL